MTMSSPKITAVSTLDVMTVTAVKATICSRVGQVTFRSSCRTSCRYSRNRAQSDLRSLAAGLPWNGRGATTGLVAA